VKKKAKHPKDMTSDELLASVFHPKAVKHIKEHVKKLNEEKERPVKK
jgi:hypothetical protein